jgi:type VI secretion system FHA domain protein
MYLTLEVVSPQAASMGTEQRKVVGPQGLTIGRVPGNDWVIADPYISKHHARISYTNGRYFVEGLGRNPIALGHSHNALSSNQPQPLSNGDRLFIDQYEILVSVVQGDAPGAPAPSSYAPGALLEAAAPRSYSDDPFALVAPASAAHDAWAAPRGSSGSVLEAGADTAPLDPLSALGGNTAPHANEPLLPPVNWQQASPLADQVQLPPVRTSAAAGIPDNWDRTGLTHMEASAQQAPSSGPRRPTPGLQRSASIAQANAGRAMGAVSSAPRASVASRSDAPVANQPGFPAQRWAPSAPSHASSLDLAELLRGAGLAEEQLSPEVLHELGRALRIIVQGAMDVLQARSEIKSQFRLPLTRVQAAENNPLKFSPNVESALHTLLVQRNPGYLGTAAAFEDAFSDIRAHQIAMLEGLRAGFEAMLASFEPDRLEQEFDRAAKRGLLGSRGGRSKFWDLYVQRFKDLNSDSDDTFRRLFGDVFADAYEEQLERFKAAGRHSIRNK